MTTPNPLRILIATDAWSPQINGVQRTYQSLVDLLTAQSHQVEVVHPGQFTTIPFPFYPEIRLALFPGSAIRARIAAFQPDAIHIATEGPIGWSTWFYCRWNKLPFSTSYHTHFPDYLAMRIPDALSFLRVALRKTAIAVMRLFHNASQLVFVATPSLEKELKAWNVTAPMVRLGRGVDPDLFYPDPNPKPLEGRKPIALYVGRVAPEKNLEAFLLMPWEGQKVVVGRGPYLELFKKKYPGVIFTGPKTGKDLSDAYRKADIFVFPSRTDTYGMVMIEAMACGLPVAAYPDVTGPKDILLEPFLGAMDPSLFNAAYYALQLVNPEDRAKRIAYSAREHRWDRVCEQFLAGLRTVRQLGAIKTKKNAPPKNV